MRMNEPVAVPEAGPQRLLQISVVTETYPPEVNGVASTAARFVHGLREIGHRVDIVRPRQAADGRGRRDGGDLLVRGLAIPRYPALRMGLARAAGLVDAWRRQRPDLVHIVTEGPLGVVALRAARRLRLPVAADFRTNFHAYSHHYGIGWAERPIRAYLRGFHNRCGATMVPTVAVRDALAAQGFERLHVVARGVDTQLFHPARRSEELRRQWGARPSAPVLIYVGRLAAEKNLGLVVDAFDALRDRCPQARLVFVGDGPMAPELRARCPQAVFAGVQRGEALAAHYASADIFAFPSLTETYGNVTLEAMASGLAIASFGVAAAAAHVRDGREGLLADPDDPRSFVRAVARLADSPTMFRACGARARTVAEGLGWQRVVLAQQAVFFDVLGGADAGAGDALRPLPLATGVLPS